MENPLRTLKVDYCRFLILKELGRSRLGDDRLLRVNILLELGYLLNFPLQCYPSTFFSVNNTELAMYSTSDFFNSP